MTRAGRSLRSLGLLALVATLLVGCPGGVQPPGDARLDVPPSDVPQPDPPDAGRDVPVYDAGPAPPCALAASARQVVERPGGDRASDPSALTPVGDGFLAGLRRLDLRPPDGGVTDGGAIPTSRDSVELLPLAADGTPRGPTVTVYDGHPEGTSVDAPLVLPTGAGAYVLFQESRGTVGSGDFLLRLRGTAVDAAGMGAVPAVLRERYTRPSMAPLASGEFLGVSLRFEGVLDGGAVSARAMSLLLRPDGSDARPQDVDLTGFVPPTASDPVMRRTEDGGAVLAFRLGGRLAFLRFDASGTLDTRGVYDVRGAALPGGDGSGVSFDAASAGDGIVAAWARAAGGRTEVHAIVAGLRGDLRLDETLEAVDDDGSVALAAVPAYGGVAVVWRRGTGAASRIAAAVVAPDGAVRVRATTLVEFAGLNGRPAVAVDGRAVSFLVRNGQPPAWGLVFGQACLPER